MMASPSGAEQNSTKTPRMNTFVNDGSFLEMYKKKMAAMKDEKNDKNEEISCEEKRKNTNLLLQGKRKIPVGKRKGTTEKTVAKKKKEEKTTESENTDEKSVAWKAYMEEVKKYKEMSCTEESDRTRPLVK